MSASSLSSSFAKRATTGEGGDSLALEDVRSAPAVVAATTASPANETGPRRDGAAAFTAASLLDDPGVATAAADAFHPDMVDFTRSGVISRILTPPSSRQVSSGPPRGVGASGYDANASRSNLNNSWLLHPNNSTGSRSSRRRHGTGSPTCVSADGRSYRHNPYLASPSTSQHFLATAHNSTDNASFGEHEGSIRELDLSRGSRSGRHHAVHLTHNGRSFSESNSHCSRTIAGTTAAIGSMRYLPGRATVHDVVGIVTTLSPNRRTAADSFSGEVSFGARSTASSAERSLRSSPSAAPFTTLFAPASAQAQRGHGSTASTAAPQHLDAPHVRELPQGSGAQAVEGGGGVSPESSALYHSFSSSNVTHSVNSNNPYVGVRMTPEPAALLQPQTLSHVRAADSASSDTRAHPLAPEYDTAALVERPRSVQPPQLQSSTVAYEDPSEASFREAQQQWVSVTQPIRVAPVYSRVSRQNSQRTTPPASAMRSGSAAASTPRTGNLSPADRYTPTNRPPLPGAAPTAIQMQATDPADYDVSPSVTQQTNPLTPPSFLVSPPGGWTNPHSPFQSPPDAAAGAHPAGYALPQRHDQQLQQQDQHALQLPPSFAAAATLSAPSPGRSGEASRAPSLVRDETHQFLPLSHDSGGEATLSPVPVAVTERVGEGYDSASQTASVANEQVPVPQLQQQQQQQQRTEHGSGVPRATLPPTESRPLPRFPPHKATVPLSPAEYVDSAVIAASPPLEAIGSTYTDILSDTSGRHTHPIQLAAHGAKVGAEALRALQLSYNELSHNGITADLNRSAASINHVAHVQQPDPQEAAATVSGVLVLKGDDEDAENEDQEEDGDDDEGNGAASQRGAGGKRKKKRSRRTRKVKVLEDLPPVTSMRYLPPPPPPPPKSADEPQPGPTSPDLLRYVAVLGRWYTRLIADEADFVDVARAGVFDAAAAAPSLSSAAQQTRDGRYTPYVWTAMPHVSWTPLSSPHSGPISPPSGPMSPPYTASSGSNLGGVAVAAEVLVRFPRVEHYVAPDNVPAALQVPASGLAVEQETPTAVKDVSGVLRWARDLETWWFCYVFPYVAHPRHQPPPTAQITASSSTQQHSFHFQPHQQQQHPVPQPYMQHASPYMHPQQHQQLYGQQQQPYMQPVAAGTPANFGSSYTSSGSTGYEYPYGWSPATAPAPQPMVMGSMSSVYSPTSQQQPVMPMSGSYTTMGSAMQSPVYGHVQVQQSMPPPPPPMPRGYLMGMYSAY